MLCVLCPPRCSDLRYVEWGHMLGQLERERGVRVTQLQLGRLRGHLKQAHGLELQVGGRVGGRCGFWVRRAGMCCALHAVPCQ